ILGIGKGILRVFSSDFPLLGVSPIPVLCSIVLILTLDFPLLEAEVALIMILSWAMAMFCSAFIAKVCTPGGMCSVEGSSCIIQGKNPLLFQTGPSPLLC
ncbi:hypothetical protein L208DRAFT_1326498, partial [Tricholoma matsutake]